MLVEAEGKKILFTGDLRHDLLDFPFDAVKDGVDVLIMEGAHAKLTNDKIVDVFKGIDTKLMLVNHIYHGMNSNEELDILKEKLKNHFDVIPSYDGFSVKI